MKSILFILLLCVLVPLTSCNKEEAPCEDSTSTVDQNKTTRKVLIIGIDGFRADALTPTSAPFLSSFSQDPFTYFTRQNQVEYHTLSGPNWTTLLTGVHWEKHLVVDNFFSFYDETNYPPFFYYIENAQASINTVSICHWLPINSRVVKEYADYSPLNLINDSAVYADGLAIIDQTSNIAGDVIFLAFDDLDHNGHLYGFHDTIPEYRQAVTTMSFYTEGLVNAVETRRSLGEDWMIFIVSDHGGEGRGHTGMPDVPSVRQTIFFANHPSASFRSNYISSQTDLAPTILSFLGIQSAAFDCKKDGVSLID